MRSLHDRVLGRCKGRKWVKENQERDKDTGHHWKDKINGCILECAGSASENRLRGRFRRLQAQRIEVVLSAHKVGAGLSVGEKNGKMARQRVLLCKGGGYADHQE